MKRKRLTADVCRELINYNMATGQLTWKHRYLDWFRTGNACAAWNRRYAGQPAFTCISHRHRMGVILGQHHMAARIAFLHHEGRWPKAIAFRNDDKTDLRWRNLIECRSAADARDYQKFLRGDQLGHVHERASGRWIARMGSKHLGVHDTCAQALEHCERHARKRWAVRGPLARQGTKQRRWARAFIDDEQ